MLPGNLLHSGGTCAKMKSKVDECKILVHEFVASSTFHGLPGVVTAPTRWMRVVWMILFLTATIISLYETTRFIKKYANKPLEVETQVSRCILYFVKT